MYHNKTDNPPVQQRDSTINFDNHYMIYFVHGSYKNTELSFQILLFSQFPGLVLKTKPHKKFNKMFFPLKNELLEWNEFSNTPV